MYRVTRRLLPFKPRAIARSTKLNQMSMSLFLFSFLYLIFWFQYVGDVEKANEIVYIRSCFGFVHSYMLKNNLMRRLC